MIRSSKGLLALSPLLVFLLVYVLSSLFVGDFGRVPVSSAFLIAAIWAVATTPGKLRERINCFSKGAGDRNILLMIWIFVLAGAFAGSAKDIGAIDATVAATLHLVPSKLIFCGLFLASCFISMSIGTSVGTIVALVPLATEMAANCGVSEAYMAAIIVGGAFFGDNLSFISDTTIASTRIMKCEMRDKFRMNIRIILPAVLVVAAIYIWQGWNAQLTGVGNMDDWYKVFPYLLVIVMAMSGIDVSIVLLTGIIANAVMGFCCGSFLPQELGAAAGAAGTEFAAGADGALAAGADGALAAGAGKMAALAWTGWLASLGRGIAAMSDLIIVTLLAGGLMELIRANGGLDFIIDRLTRHIKGERGAQFSIAALVCIADICTANNTIAIISTGSIAKEISDRFGLDPRKTASILDTFSCLIQGIIPYGAQLLIAAGLAGISSASIIPHLYYPFLMGTMAVLSIIFRFPRNTVKPQARG